MFENYYCAQLKFNAPQRSSINPNLTCIWSQFGRGKRPRTEGTVCVHAQKEGSKSTSGDFSDSQTLHAEPAGLFREQVCIFIQFVLLLSHPDLPRPVLCSADRAVTLQGRFFWLFPWDRPWPIAESSWSTSQRAWRLGLGQGIFPRCKIQEGDEKPQSSR